MKELDNQGFCVGCGNVIGNDEDAFQAWDSIMDGEHGPFCAKCITEAEEESCESYAYYSHC